MTDDKKRVCALCASTRLTVSQDWVECRACGNAEHKELGSMVENKMGLTKAGVLWWTVGYTSGDIRRRLNLAQVESWNYSVSDNRTEVRTKTGDRVIITGQEAAKYIDVYHGISATN